MLRWRRAPAMRNRYRPPARGAPASQTAPRTPWQSGSPVPRSPSHRGAPRSWKTCALSVREAVGSRQWAVGSRTHDRPPRITHRLWYPVSDVADCLDHVGGGGADLAAEPADMGIDGTETTVEVVSPHVVEDCLTGD